MLALGLGLIRKYANTTACCASHVAYNLITGTGLPGPLAYVAIGVEVVLIAVVIYAFATRARKSEEPISAGLG